MFFTVVLTSSYWIRICPTVLTIQFFIKHKKYARKNQCFWFGYLSCSTQMLKFEALASKFILHFSVKGNDSPWEPRAQKITHTISLSSLVCCLINSVCALSQRLIPLVPLMCKRQGEGIQRTDTEQIDHMVVLSMVWGRSPVRKDNTTGQLSCIIGKGLLVDLCRMRRIFLKHCIHV